MAKISVQIVTWNSMRYIFDCMESLMRQTYRDFSILIIDNGSDDETVSFIRSNYPTVSVLQNFRNLGYAKANNQGMLMAKSEYILVINPDVILKDNYLEELIKFADHHSDSAAFGGKILKLKSEAFDVNDQGMREAVQSNIIDSTGLEIYKSRKVIDRGEGEIDEGQFNETQEVFGLTGACVLYRKSALMEVAIKNEIFDQDFISYKEDVDLSWRLRLYGFACWYVPAAICFHHRGFAGGEKNQFRKIIKERKKISKYLRANSFRNQHLMLVKNDEFRNIIFAFPWIFFREIKMFFSILFFEPFQYKTIVDFFKLVPRTLIKRKVIMNHKKISSGEMRKWFK